METAILTSLISGCFSLATALGSVWLKHHLESRARSVETARAPSAAKAKGSSPSRQMSMARPLVVLLVGLVIGVVSRALRPHIMGPVHYEAIVTLGLLVAVTLALVLSHRQSSHGLWPFQLEAFSLWAAFASGWSLMHGGVWTDLIAVAVPWWLGCAVVGGAMLTWLRPKHAT